LLNKCRCTIGLENDSAGIDFMSQVIHYFLDNFEVCREMPDAGNVVITGVQWGEPWTLFTPSYWLSQLWMSGLDKQAYSRYRAGGSLPEEVVYCMLGGNGISAELATAAFEACRKSELIVRLETSAAKWSDVLQGQLQLNGQLHRYRFPHQKARYLAAAMAFFQTHSLSTNSGRELRDSLLTIKGIGPKTAGWIARNYLDTDEVAILDVHLVRAGLLCDLFSPSQQLRRDYFAMEARFIEFCRALDARPAVLDCLIWDQMRATGDVALNAVRSKFSDSSLCTTTPVQNRIDLR
jgi:N-glycosylase/DNA lyase